MKHLVPVYLIVFLTAFGYYASLFALTKASCITFGQNVGDTRNIAEFQLRTLSTEAVTMSPIMLDGQRPGVKYMTLSWSPKLIDVGKHIICVTAVDNERESPMDDVCYVLNVLRKVRLIGPPVMTKHFQVGDPVVLDCLITGTNSPIFYWRKESGCDGHIESYNGSILNVTSHATIGHEGMYVCVGSDGIYQNVTKHFHVQIARGSSYREDCSLEHGVCGWQQKQTDTMDWALIKGPTQTSNTGPDMDHTMATTTGTYFYMETSSPIQLGDSAGLVSHILPANTSVCFNFWYHMYGDGVGSMSVHVQSLFRKMYVIGINDGSDSNFPANKALRIMYNVRDSCTLKDTTLFTVTGEQGNKWIEHELLIPDTMVVNDYRIIIEGVAGNTFRGDIGIDDLVITEGPCLKSVPIIIG